MPMAYAAELCDPGGDTSRGPPRDCETCWNMSGKAGRRPLDTDEDVPRIGLLLITAVLDGMQNVREALDEFNQAQIGRTVGILRIGFHMSLSDDHRSPAFYLRGS